MKKRRSRFAALQAAKHVLHGKTPGVDYKIHSGVCYSKKWFRDQELAEAYAAEVRASGATVNGGWFHGMPLGGVSTYEWDSPESPWVIENGGKPVQVWEVMD